MELQEKADQRALPLFLGDGVGAEMIQPAPVFVNIQTVGGVRSQEAGDLRNVNMVPVLAYD